MKRYSVLLLDLDGTLLDFNRAQEEALRRVFERHDIACSEKNLATYARINHDLWKQLELGLITKDELQRTRFQITFDELGMMRQDGAAFAAEFKEELGQGSFLIDHVLETLNSLKQEYELVAITNGIKETQYRRLDKSGLRPYFKHIFISDEMGCQKPMKEYFEKVFEVLNEKDIRKLLVVGDTLSSDILGANNADLDCCWINAHKEPIPMDIHPTYVIEHIEDLITLLKQQ